MPDFAVATHFTVHEQLLPFFSKGASAANKFEGMVSGAFRRSGKEASLFSSILGGVTLGNLASRGIESGLRFLKDIPEQLSAMAEKGEALGRTAEIIGVNADALQRFNYAAKMTDTNVEGMQTALQKMNKGLGEMRVNSGTIVTGLKKLNPELLAQLRTAKDSPEAFLMVAEAMKKSSTAQERAAIATSVFGRAGQDMIPMLLKGKDGISALMAETDKYSGIMSEEAIKASGEFADAMKKTSGVMQSLKNAAITPLLVALTPYLDELVEWINANRVLIKQDIKGFVTGLTQGLKVIIPIIRDILWLVQNFGGPVLAAVVAFNTLKYSLLAVAAAGKIFALINVLMEAYALYAGGACTAQEALNLVMVANPIGLICAAIAILVGLMVLLASKVGGLGNAFTVVGQTMMKWFLIPINSAIDGVKMLIGMLAKIPGLGGLKDVAAGLDAFQAKTNTMLTGSETHGFSSLADPYKNARKKELDRQAPNQAAIERQDSTYSGRLEIAGAPAGSRLTQQSQGPAQIRTELLGVNP